MIGLWDKGRNGDRRQMIHCCRCGNPTPIAEHDDFLGSQTLCSDCEDREKRDPAWAKSVTAFEQRRAEADSVAMRERWARQDAARAAAQAAR